MRPAGETGQLGKSGDSRGGTGEGTEATGERRGRTGVPWVGTAAKTWHLRAQAPKVSIQIPAHPLAGCVALCQ